MLTSSNLQYYIDTFNSLPKEHQDYVFAEMSKNHLIKKNQAKTLQKWWRKILEK